VSDPEAVAAGGHRCRWSFLERAADGDPRRVGVGCDDPHVLICSGCSRTVLARCGTSRQSRCGPCGTAYRGRVGHVARSGLVVSRVGLFVTLTAPGAVPHRLPHGALCPCTPPGGVDLARWNAELSRRERADGKLVPGRWNELVKALRREVGDDALAYFRATEVQRRGALHLHVMLRRSDGRPLALDVGAVRRLALRYGFGHAVDVQPVAAGHADYVAKYVSKAANDRQDVPWSGWKVTGGRWVNRTTGEVCERPRRKVKSYHPSYRTWTASRAWGRSMAEVRAAQSHYLATVEALALDRPVPPRPDYSERVAMSTALDVGPSVN
jgi:hypothetical protein